MPATDILDDAEAVRADLTITLEVVHDIERVDSPPARSPSSRRLLPPSVAIEEA